MGTDTLTDPLVLFAFSVAVGYIIAYAVLHRFF
jgi:hypothetical protein